MLEISRVNCVAGVRCDVAAEVGLLTSVICLFALIASISAPATLAK